MRHRYWLGKKQNAAAAPATIQTSRVRKSCLIMSSSFSTLLSSGGPGQTHLALI